MQSSVSILSDVKAMQISLIRSKKKQHHIKVRTLEDSFFNALVAELNTDRMQLIAYSRIAPPHDLSQTTKERIHKMMLACQHTDAIGTLVAYSIAKIVDAHRQVFLSLLERVEDSDVLTLLHILAVLCSSEDNPLFIETDLLDELAKKIRTVFSSRAFDKKSHSHLYANYIYAIYQRSRPPSFGTLSEDLMGFYKETLKIDVTKASTIYTSAFLISWHTMSSFSDQISMRDNLVIPGSKALSTDCSKPGRRTNKRNELSSNERRRVCYWCTQLSTASTYANGRSIYSYLKAHFNAKLSNFDFYVYYTREAADSKVVNEIRSWGFVVRELNPNQDEKVIEATFKEDQIDIIIHENYGWTSLKLFSLRQAPVQIYLSLGFTLFESVDVDYILAPERFRNNALYPHVNKPMLWHPSFVDRSFIDSAVDPEDVKRARGKLTTTGIVIGSYGRLEKIHDGYLELVSKLLHAHPSAVCVLCGPGDSQRLSRFARANGLGERIHLPGIVNPHLYGRVLDVFLDTFPVCGGMAGLEVQAKGVPVVHMANSDIVEIQHQRHPELIAQSTEEYFDIASKLISNPEHRKRISKEVKTFNEQFVDSDKFALVVEEQFLACIRNSNKA